MIGAGNHGGMFARLRSLDCIQSFSEVSICEGQIVEIRSSISNLLRVAIVNTWRMWQGKMNEDELNLFVCD